jgi:uncharacterized protein YndB with AHSA1/START domain
MPDLQHEIFVNAPAEKVYAALTTQNGLRGWWTTDATIEGRVGGSAQFGFDKRATVFRMKVEELTPSKRVVLSCHGDVDEWKGTRLTWEIVPKDRGSIVQFRRANWREATHLFAICNSSWGELMHRLKDYSVGKNRGPLWTE